MLNLGKLLYLRDAQPFAFMVALIFSLFLTPFVRDWAGRLKLLDQPGGRHLHKNPVPRLGGIAIYFSLLVSCLILVILYGRYTPRGAQPFELVGLAVGGTLIFVVGLLDDLSPLPALLKLASQIAASVLAWFCNVKVLFLVNPLYFIGLSQSRVWELDPILSFVVTIGWLVLITNALNLIDGLDGLAAGVALIVALSLWAILLDPKIDQPAGALLASSIAGAVMGFLRWNYNPAQIFLGDSGAYFLGFVLGGTAVAGLSGNPNTSTVGSVVVLAFMFPIFELCFTIIRRLIQGKPVMQPDSDHIHHRFLRAGLSTKRTMLIIVATCFLLGLVAATLSGAHKRYLILLLMTLSLAILSGFWRRHPIDNSSSTTNLQSKT
ncbi:MAG: MraY family glycosyltransferase [Candidatus Caenarcaniphilales bacterium]|nr:MraY family glycosyltransferase [Candidatus Caenarcaniphilales bacterium]